MSEWYFIKIQDKCNEARLDSLQSSGRSYRARKVLKEITGIRDDYL